ncbi:hypothetical protein PXJ20_22310 [Paraburkholderia sp. A1RI_3L]|jgi:Ni/Co efflux regulator RcnB|nr:MULTISPECIES: hypothetical protein [Paraburkholderia]WEY41840.1 hypothetical protein P2869_30830 [Paraburkholderia sp. SUR17]
MKRILLAIISSAALLATATGAAHAAQATTQNNASTCQGPASYCNVFFGQ